MRTKNLLALLAFTIFFSFSVNAQDYFKQDRTSTQTQKHQRNRNGSVGAPLDGGLLAILGAAGVAYFTARKKKKNGEVL